MDVIISGLAGLSIGLGGLIWFILKNKGGADARTLKLNNQVRELENSTHSLATENRLQKEEIQQAAKLESELREQIKNAEKDKIESLTKNEDLNRRLQDQLKEQENAHNQMQERFENLANKILEQKSAKFTEANKENLKTVLGPLDKDIRNFRKKVEDLHEKETSQHSALREYLEGLKNAQAQLSMDAQNLTSALKGDSKKQGDWGEFILERTLEASGLVKGQEFSMQETFDRQRPDAIIFLPEDRQIIVDSKVSLTAYERSYSCRDEASQKTAIKEHLQSIKKHIDELSAKDYSAIEELNTLDFVLMFIPVEPAFGAALTEDPELYQYAFEKKIILVTSSTLMATIKTVANLWKLEKQNKHARDVAKRAGLLYDKFIGFLTSIEDIGKALGKATLAHQNAVGQLSTGNGHLIGQVEKLRKMGIQTKKELPTSFANFEEDKNSQQEELGLVETEDQQEDKIDRLA